MTKIIITEFISLDGVMEGPGGDNDFARGAWSFEFDRGDAGNRFKLEETLDAAALLLGRVTYEGFAQAWPERSGDEFSDKFNSMPKYVVSSTLTDPTWTNTTVVGGDVAAAVATIKDEVDGDVVVHGSAQLAQALIAQDLVDELRLMIHPVVLGTGKQLFADTDEAKRYTVTRLELVGDDGVAVAVYERAR